MVNDVLLRDRMPLLLEPYLGICNREYSGESDLRSDISTLERFLFYDNCLRFSFDLGFGKLAEGASGKLLNLLPDLDSVSQRHPQLIPAMKVYPDRLKEIDSESEILNPLIEAYQDAFGGQTQ